MSCGDGNLPYLSQSHKKWERAIGCIAIVGIILMLIFLKK